MQPQRTFSAKQVASIVTAAIIASAGGAALTVSASDAVQDSKIERLESEAARITAELQRTTAAVNVVQAEVRAVKETVDNTREDIADLRSLVIQAISK